MFYLNCIKVGQTLEIKHSQNIIKTDLLKKMYLSTDCLISGYSLKII